jgi:hypothetical protein
MSPGFKNIQKQFETVRSQTLTDRRFLLESMYYIYAVVLFAGMLVPVKFFPSLFFETSNQLGFFRNQIDFIYLSNNSSKEFFSQYRTVYSFQTFITVTFIIIYGIICISSKEIKYFRKYKESYFSANFLFSIAITFSLIFLFGASEFGITATNSWFEDNPNRSVSFFPAPMNWVILVVTASCFGFIGMTSMRLLENAILFMFGRRIEG